MKRRSRELTPKEIDLIKLIATGWKDKEITERFNIGSSTIRNTLNKALVKTETFNRPQLVYWACKNNVI